MTSLWPPSACRGQQGRWRVQQGLWCPFSPRLGAVTCPGTPQELQLDPSLNPFGNGCQNWGLSSLLGVVPRGWEGFDPKGCGLI